MSNKRITGTIAKTTTSQTARHGFVTNIVITTIGQNGGKTLRARAWNNQELAALPAGALIQAEGSWSRDQADGRWDLVIHRVSEVRKIDPATVDISKYL